MHISVPLAMFCLDTMALNYDLCERAQNLKDRLIQFQVDVNRDTNARYCQVYRERTLLVGTNGGNVDRICTSNHEHAEPKMRVAVNSGSAGR